MEGWVDLGSPIAAWLGVETTTAWSQVRRFNRYATESPCLWNTARLSCTVVIALFSIIAVTCSIHLFSLTRECSTPAIKLLAESRESARGHRRLYDTADICMFACIRVYVSTRSCRKSYAWSSPRPIRRCWPNRRCLIIICSISSSNSSSCRSRRQCRR